MKRDYFRLLEELSGADELQRQAERDALRRAKARQDQSSANLDNWIAATITELTGQQGAPGKPRKG